MVVLNRKRCRCNFLLLIIALPGLQNCRFVTFTDWVLQISGPPISSRSPTFSSKMAKDPRDPKAILPRHGRPTPAYMARPGLLLWGSTRNTEIRSLAVIYGQSPKPLAEDKSRGVAHESVEEDKPPALTTAPGRHGSQYLPLVFSGRDLMLVNAAKWVVMTARSLPENVLE
ncbi:hypothetical protein J6590_005212 [Homalodisca vitripennis]|nr:hypothetical protein J6590_005212 [Homalodisca vitripennis]